MTTSKVMLRKLGARLRGLLAQCRRVAGCEPGPAVLDAPLGDLETRGFVVIPSFLSPAEVKELAADYCRARSPGNLLYDLRTPSRRAVARVRPKVERAISQVSASTRLRVDLYEGAVYFSTARRSGFPWHQDHESYFLTQNHFDYLNFYVPVVKPSRTKTNLSVLPFDALRSKSAAAYDRLVGRGATRLVASGERTVLHDSNDDSTAELDFCIEDIAVTPELDVGDLLLLRGDVAHRTQDADTERVAISLRAVRSSTVVRKSVLVAGGAEKLYHMTHGAARVYASMLDAFRVAQRDELTLGEGLEHRRRNPRPSLSRQELEALLLDERARAGAGGDRGHV